MGTVYRAEDSKLGRDVAIKVLPQEFAADSERLARFERETRTREETNPSPCGLPENQLTGHGTGRRQDSRGGCAGGSGLQ